MAQVFLKRRAKVEQDGPNVVVSFECVNEEQADRLVRSFTYGMIRGSVKFSVKIEDKSEEESEEESKDSNVVRLN